MKTKQLFIGTVLLALLLAANAAVAQTAPMSTASSRTADIVSQAPLSSPPSGPALLLAARIWCSFA
ncbi:MAG: hypothetical protein C4325_14340 [Blastocatellia bacterium]